MRLNTLLTDLNKSKRAAWGQIQSHKQVRVMSKVGSSQDCVIRNIRAHPGLPSHWVIQLSPWWLCKQERKPDRKLITSQNRVFLTLTRENKSRASDAWELLSVSYHSFSSRLIFFFLNGLRTALDAEQLFFRRSLQVTSLWRAFTWTMSLRLRGILKSSSIDCL